MYLVDFPSMFAQETTYGYMTISMLSYILNLMEKGCTLKGIYFHVEQNFLEWTAFDRVTSSTRASIPRAVDLVSPIFSLSCNLAMCLYFPLPDSSSLCSCLNSWRDLSGDIGDRGGLN